MATDVRAEQTTTALPAAPTLEIPLLGGVGVSEAIINDATPVVIGTLPTGSTAVVTLDGSDDADAGFGPLTASGDTYEFVFDPLTPGLHQLDAVATNQAGSTVGDPLSLLVLPDLVGGITTAAVSSFQFASVVDQGYSEQLVGGTEAIQLTDGTLSVGADTIQASVQRLYEGLLGRAGDTGGLAQFTSLSASFGTAPIVNTTPDLTFYDPITGGVPVVFTAYPSATGTAAVASAILGSAEFQLLHGAAAAMSDTQFVTLLYDGLLGRAPDAGGLALYVATLQGGASQGEVAASIANSAEAETHLAADTANVWVPDAAGATVTEFYQTAFGHAPDLGGLGLFTTSLQGGLSVQQLAQQLAASPEFLADHAGQGNAALVTSLYESGLGRAPSAADLQSWAGAGAATVLLGVAASPEAAVHLIRNV